jgi:large subunit ribosomal protein L11
MKMNKIKQQITLNVPANQATAKAPLGPTLGQYGIPIADFCKKFNELSTLFLDGTILKANVDIFENGDYQMKLDIPNNNFFIKKAVNNTAGSSLAGKYKLIENKKVSCIISSFALYEICKIKYNNMSEKSMKRKFKNLIGSLKSMGIIIIPSRLLISE